MNISSDSLVALVGLTYVIQTLGSYAVHHSHVQIAQFPQDVNQHDQVNINTNCMSCFCHGVIVCCTSVYSTEVNYVVYS